MYIHNFAFSYYSYYHIRLHSSIFAPSITVQHTFYMVDVILGLQWGDEGKGKIVDYFAPRYDIIARFQGGPNAGHTLYM